MLRQAMGYTALSPAPSTLLPSSWIPRAQAATAVGLSQRSADGGHSSASGGGAARRGAAGHANVSIMSGDEDDDEGKLLEPGLDQAFKNVERLERALRGEGSS